MYLEDWIKKKHMSYIRFSTLMNIDRTTLFKWITGKIKPNSINIKKIKLLTKGKVTYDEISKT